MQTVSEDKMLLNIKRIFIAVVLLVLGYLFFGSAALAGEAKPDTGKYGVMKEGWTLIRENGTREQVELPGKFEAERNEFLVLENVLPVDVEDNTYLFFRSSKQETKIYVDGVLREEYSTKDTRPWGKVSAVMFMLVELHEEDAGKLLRVENRTDTSYSGQYYKVRYGEKWEIWASYFQESGFELLVGIFMLVLGIAAIVISIALKYSYKKNIAMLYLGIGVFMGAIWLLANSVFRQIIFPSISVVSDMAFFMVMLMGIPFMLYLNDVQGRRYCKAYCIMIGLVLVDAVVCTTLHIGNIVDFSDTIGYMGFFDALSIFFMAGTVIKDIKTKKIQEYRLVALGIASICVVAIVDLIIYFWLPNYFSGSVIAIGLVILLVISFINTMKDVLYLEKEKQKAITASEAKGNFLSNMSHEIRTPINAVLGMDTMILRETKEENIREYAMNIQNAGQTLLSLINDILDFSKIESGKMEIIPVEYDFSSMIHDIVNMIKMKANDKGLEMKVSVDNTLPFRIYGDEVRIRQVLINLLNNAVKYTPEGSVSLNVQGTRAGENVLLTFEVKDTGIGIKEEDISKLFSRFERIEEERNRNIEGTGLGMSITLQLLKMMESELRVESTYGVGSTFAFTLSQKIIKDEPVGDLQERIRSMSSEFKYAASFVAPNAHVLVVDDNKMNLNVFRNLLKQTKCRVAEAESGMECLELVQNNHYDMIFLDHMMPEVDGIETLHRMKALTDYPCKSTPVIALTANAISGAREMYLKEGFDDFLSKPIRPEKLEKMIVQYLPEHLLQTEVEQQETEMPETKSEKQKQCTLPEIEGIDYESALCYAPNEEMLLESMREFYVMVDRDAEALKGFYDALETEAGSLDGYRIKVHAMKSTAALIGACALSEQAKRLEFAAKDHEMETIYKETAPFLEYWLSFKDKLAVFAEKETDKTEIGDVLEIKEKLERLQAAMEIMDIDMADALVKELQQYQYQEDISQKMELLASAVMNLDIDNVAEITQNMIEQI